MENHLIENQGFLEKNMLSRLLLIPLLGPLLELWLILRNCQQSYQGTQLLYLSPECYHLLTKLVFELALSEEVESLLRQIGPFLEKQRVRLGP
ncbi:transmembrane protein, putative [Medicago truncatula]|uniref:Transmembrane protein, putative n=1 Tax=Medicago truncatula TaxID=3880 RepID=G7K8F1_MEDTR|nr:transmembrane protein, putative [Medicago truncatula]